MKVTEAVALVVQDARQGFSPSEMTDEELLVYTYETVGVKEVQGDDDLAKAYHIVLDEMDRGVAVRRQEPRDAAVQLLDR